MCFTPPLFELLCQALKGCCDPNGRKDKAAALQAMQRGGEGSRLNILVSEYYAGGKSMVFTVVTMDEV